MSYRDSHRDKGADYQETFVTLPHRAMLWRMERRLLDRIVDERFPGHAPSYLDFACGTGRVLQHLAARSSSPVGIDVSASMLALARKNVPSAEIIEADLSRDDPLSGRRFELITAFRFFANAEPELRLAVMRALAAHLDPRGLLVFNNHKQAASLARRVSGLLGRKRSADQAEREGDRTMSHEQVCELVAAAGLRVIAQHPLGVLPFTDLHMLRPAWLLESLERVLGALPGSGPLAQSVVYLCGSSTP